jgi:hypothetical protein
MGTEEVRPVEHDQLAMNVEVAHRGKGWISATAPAAPLARISRVLLKT